MAGQAVKPRHLLLRLANLGVSVSVEGDSLLIDAPTQPDAETLHLLRINKASLLQHLRRQREIPRLPWELERLLDAASGGHLQCEVRGVPDVNRYALSWGCAYLTGDRDEAVRRLWTVHAAWRERDVN